MRRTIIMGIALVAMSLGSVSAKAGMQNTAQPCPHCGRYHAVSNTAHQPAQKNVFSRMWELEKRKNAWLMRTFLGR